MSAIRQLLNRVKTEGVKRPDSVTTVSMGRSRTFEAYDLETDTFVFEKGIESHLDERPSVLMVEKQRLGQRGKGHVLTLSTGNHAVAAFPLLDGRFWNLSNLPSENRSSTLSGSVLCANVVRDTLELSQREISTADLVSSDEWLLGAVGFSKCNVVMGERNESTLEHYRRRGEEWRVKPLAWTESEMRVALDASRKRIATKISYYHSVRGVHFLSYAEFYRFSMLAETDIEAFVAGLKELVGVYEGNECSFMKMPKYRGHHEIELFGLSRGVAFERLLPELENLFAAIECHQTGVLGIIQKIQDIAAIFKSLLSNPELEDETSKAFAEALYMCITGEVYSVVGGGSTPAFDDRRTPLPGATFSGGRAVLHPGADDRTEVLLSNLRGMMSKDEIIEYANVYELRAQDSLGPVGSGSTREVVYKTSHRPLENSLVEKRLSRTAVGYGSYVIARIGALRALGVSLSDYYLLLKRRPGSGKRSSDYYIRRRCEGEPMDAVPANYFRSAKDASVEDGSFVLALAALMGDAAAQNMAMKKYDPKTATPLYGVGKEIYEFEYDIIRERVVPKKVSTCSIRGSFGWPSVEYTDENFNEISQFYLSHYMTALKSYSRRHPVVPIGKLAERFMDGFVFRTHTMSWQLAGVRDRFEAFDPGIPLVYDFVRKWRFVMWSLDRQDHRLSSLRHLFLSMLPKEE